MKRILVAIVAIALFPAISARRVRADGAHYQLVENWVHFPPEVTKWGQATGVDVDSHDNVFVFHRNELMPIMSFDKRGNFITRWTQFGKPSAIAIDTKGHIYVADGMSNERWNPGWERGIRVGDIKTGWVKAFLPDELDTGVGNGAAGTEFLGVDPEGNIFQLATRSRLPHLFGQSANASA